MKNKFTKSYAKKLMKKHMDIAQPNKMATDPDPNTIRPWSERPKTPDSTRMAHYWMAVGISLLLD